MCLCWKFRSADQWTPLDISSSTVKELIGPKGWEDKIKKYVPDVVHKKLLERFK